MVGEWYQEGFLKNLFTFVHYKNYARNKADLALWEQDAMKQQLVNPYPFRLPDTEIEVKEPRMDAKGRYDKRHNWLIVAPPTSNKTFWVQTEFKGKKAYMRNGQSSYKFPFEAQQYSDEPVIIYDDVVPQCQELIDVTNVWNVQKHVWGESRYGAKHWKLGQCRTVIWLLNEDAVPEYCYQESERYSKFRERFRFLWGERFDTEDGEWYVYWDEIDHLPPKNRNEGGNPGVWVNPGSGVQYD